METLINLGKKFYGICITALAIQQLFYGDFRPVFMPDSSWLPGLAIWAYLGSLALIAAGIAIIFNKHTKTAALLLAGSFLILFLFYHVPHLLFINPNGKILGAWANALKELALAGGALAVAGSYVDYASQDFPMRQLEKLIPFGRIFFSITMITFGIVHFEYADFVKELVPDWIPAHLFWTYFAGIALIGSGIAIIFKIRLWEIAILLGSMIFLWFIMLHIPRAIADPFGNKGNEVTSVFQALGFSGIAFIIACSNQLKGSRI